VARHRTGGLSLCAILFLNNLVICDILFTFVENLRKNMARRPRESSGTGIYHVMLRGINRQNIFDDEEDYSHFISVLYQQVCPTDEITGKPLPSRCIFYAYCLMSNHVHLLIRESSESLASVIKRIAVSYAQYYNKKYIRFGHLFQDRFKSEPVNDNAYFFTLLQYIHQNPVAAGISVDVAGYRWSSWGEYERAGVGIQEICCTKHVLARMPLDELREFVKTLLPATQAILDFDSGNGFKSDEEVKDFLSTRFSIKAMDVQVLNRDKQDEILRELKEYGATLRQLVRLTGLSFSVVRRA
jgi:REP element-mobilizing transposase RayT